MDDEKRLRKRYEKRWRNIEDKTENIDRLELPDKEELWKKILNRYRNKWTCEYCGQELMIKDSKYPYSQSFSIDHKVSIDLGGSNDLENLTICCHRCNIIKSTMTADTFKSLLNCPEPLVDNKQILEEGFKELFRGRLSNKLEREDNRG